MKLVPVIMRCFFFSLNIVTGAYNYMVWNFILTSCDVFALLLAKTNYLYSGLLFFLCVRTIKNVQWINIGSTFFVKGVVYRVR